MEIKNKNVLVIVALFLLFAIGIINYGGFSAMSGLIMILAIIILGIVSLVWHDNDVKLACLIAIILLGLINVSINYSNMKAGIDFSGGTRIPITLEKAVDSQTMDDLLLTIRKRATVLGLSNPRVKSVGGNQIIIELPNGDQEQLLLIEETLSKQGIYTGIVSGQVAIAGKDIYSQSISSIKNANYLQQIGADWGVSFSVNKKGADQFATAAKGKPDYPIYMFLDRPEDTIIVASMSDLRANTQIDITNKEVLNAIKDSLALQGDDIELYLTDDLNDNSTIEPKTNKTRALISNSTSEEIKQILVSRGFIIKEVPANEFSPQFNPITTSQELRVDSWNAVGLLSAPSLSPQITTGIPSYNYIVTGTAKGTTTQEKRKDATDNERKIESILKGGSLPVQISLGSRTSIPPTLGNEFLKLSFIGLIAVVVAISIFIGIRYRRIKLILPIIGITIAELIVLVSILGSFEIDLAAIAGIIAALGVGVDSQIVITDELLKKNDSTHEEKISYAFGIIRTNVIVAVIAMVPLLFGVYFGIVEVVGFAISTMLGALLGFLLTRPAYAVLADKILD
ncbi:MAG: hypothetical protein Q7S22_06540 [Candidatus Micrarchaeota archaeon]|nr:hypothetical protein [Candidatus Micrarchaeota archaeon]